MSIALCTHKNIQISQIFLIPQSWRIIFASANSRSSHNHLRPINFFVLRRSPRIKYLLTIAPHMHFICRWSFDRNIYKLSASSGVQAESKIRVWNFNVKSAEAKKRR